MMRRSTLILAIALFTANTLRAEEKQPLRIMPLGDSITCGYTDNSRWAHPFESGYRSGLYTRLKKAGYDFVFVGQCKEPYDKKYGDPTHGGTVFPTVDLRGLGQDGHRGYGGWNAPAIQKNIAKWMKEDRPDIILLLIGINGISANSPQQLDSLVKTIYEADKEVKLIVAQITPLKTFNQNLFHYNTYMRKTLVPTYAKKKYTISTVDLYRHFLTDPNDPKSIDINRLSNRYNHPTNAMYDKMAASWFEGIESLLAEKKVDDVPTTGIDNPNLQSFDRMMTAFLQEHQVPGGSLAVSRNGVLVYARGFGFRDKGNKLPVKPTTQFRIASISKPITAAAILTLVQRKKISLDDKLPEFLDAETAEKLPPQLKDITIRQLLQHRGGWDRDKSFDPMFRTVMIGQALHRKQPADKADIIEYMLKRPPDFEPNTQYAYSNFGYCLLGRIIEKVSKQPYDEFVQKEIFAPLGIKSTLLGQTLKTAPNETRYYPRNPRNSTGVVAGVIGKQVPIQYGGWNIENMDSHGGWIASAPNLVKFADGFNQKGRTRLLTRKLREEMFSPAMADKTKDVFYGLGWSVRKVRGGTGINTWHTGGLDGTSTILVHRYDGLNWAVLFNSDFGNNGKRLASIIDPLVHKAANEVRIWPRKAVRLK